MSNCIAQEMLRQGKTGLYQTAPILLESIIDYKMSKNKNSIDNIYKSILEADLLIIDDLGTESLNSMKLSELFTVINTRILNLNNKISVSYIFFYYCASYASLTIAVAWLLCPVIALWENSFFYEHD